MTFNPVTVTLKNGEIITIREVELSDAKRLLQMIQESVKTSDYLLLSNDEMYLTVEQERDWIHSVKNTKGVLLLVAENKTKIIGDMELRLGSYKKTSHVGTIGITVIEEYRSMGLGSSFFNIMLNYVKQNPNIKILRLNVFSSNKIAIRLYQKFGFQIDAVLKNSYKLRDGHYEDEILMSHNI